MNEMCFPTNGQGAAIARVLVQSATWGTSQGPPAFFLVYVVILSMACGRILIGWQCQYGCFPEPARTIIWIKTGPRSGCREHPIPAIWSEGTAPHDLRAWAGRCRLRRDRPSTLIYCGWGRDQSG
jgi:hypothetical protein